MSSCLLAAPSYCGCWLLTLHTVTVVVWQMLLTLMYIWMYTLPFPVAAQFGWASPPVCVLLGFALFGLNAVGAELEVHATVH